MAWLQNLAGKAEDLLNKVDQNAARVLNEPTTSLNQAQLEGTCNEIESCIDLNPPAQIESDNPSLESVNEEFREDASDPNDSSSNGAFEKIKSLTDSVGLISVSSDNSVTIDMADVALTVKLEAHIAHLESENEELCKQILNLQHLHSGLQLDYADAQTQLARANEVTQQSQNEMQEYRARARRMLEDQLKSAPMMQSDHSSTQEIVQINQEIKNELEGEIARNTILGTRLTSITKELATLQQQYLTMQKDNQRTVDSIRMNINSERKARENVEEENRLITKELKRANKSVEQLKQLENDYKSRIDLLEEQLKMRVHHIPQAYETQVQLVNHTLMQKQIAMDTLTSEMNALKIRLEKAEQTQRCVQTPARPTETSTPGKTYEDTRIPRLVQISPLDAGMTQRVKHAYSTLDTFSIRTGVFLRRYPLARIFLICYMMLLHLWVLFVLLIYVPGSR